MIKDSSNFIDDENFIDYENFIDDIIDVLEDFGYIPYSDFIDLMQEHLNIKINKTVLMTFWGKPKKVLLDSFEDKDITKADIDKFFMTLKKGRDFYTFRYFIKTHNLERDSNHMISFTKDFPYLTDFKYEPLFIDCIIENIRQHPILGHFKNEIHMKLQFNFAKNKLIKKGKKLYDIAFPDLGVIIEIDENHNISTNKNDNLKSSYVKLNGMILFRISVKEILSKKRQRKKSIGEKLYNSPILNKKLDEIMSTLLAAFCIKEKKVMQYFIINECKKYITEFRDSIQCKVEKYHTELIKADENNKEMIRRIFNDFTKNLNVINDILDEKSLSNFTNYFELKYNSINNNKSIPATVFTTFEIFKYQHIDELKYMLISYNIINKHVDILESVHINDIFLSWQQFGLIISILEHKNAIIKQRTLYYYNNIERAFDTYHDMIKKYVESIRPTETDALRVITFFESKVHESYQEELQKITDIIEDDYVIELIDSINDKFKL